MITAPALEPKQDKEKEQITRYNTIRLGNCHTEFDVDSCLGMIKAVT